MDLFGQKVRDSKKTVQVGSVSCKGGELLCILSQASRVEPCGRPSAKPTGQAHPRSTRHSPWRCLREKRCWSHRCSPGVLPLWSYGTQEEYRPLGELVCGISDIKDTSSSFLMLVPERHVAYELHIFELACWDLQHCVSIWLRPFSSNAFFAHARVVRALEKVAIIIPRKPHNIEVKAPRNGCHVAGLQQFDQNVRELQLELKMNYYELLVIRKGFVLPSRICWFLAVHLSRKHRRWGRPASCCEFPNSLAMKEIRKDTTQIG